MPHPNSMKTNKSIKAIETRSGEPWTEQEDFQLIDAIAEFIIDTAREHQRTEAALATRVARHLDGSAIAKAIKRIKNETYYT